MSELPLRRRLMLVLTLRFNYGSCRLTSAFAAIIAHKGIASFALGTEYVKAGISRKQLLLVATLFSLTTPSGVLIGNDLWGALSLMIVSCVIPLSLRTLRVVYRAL